jgi:hypothetical protein
LKLSHSEASFKVKKFYTYITTFYVFYFYGGNPERKTYQLRNEVIKIQAQDHRSREKEELLSRAKVTAFTKMQIGLENVFMQTDANPL